jgi:hypothetical protein
MAEKVGDLYAELKLKKDNFEKNLTTSEKRIRKFKATAKVAFQAIGIAVAAFTAEMVKATKAAMEQEKQTMALRSILKELGLATREETDALIKYSEALQLTTAYSDEEIQAGMAMLGTFQMTADQIRETMPRLLDMASYVSMNEGRHIELTDAAKRFGMALNDNVGLMKRWGVILNEEAVEADRYNGLLVSIDENYKNQADTYVKTTEGAMKRMRNMYNELEEALGFGLLPYLKEYIKLMTEEMQGADGLATQLKDLGAWVGKTGIILMRFVNNAREMMTDFGAHMTNVLAGTLEVMAKIPGLGKKFEGAAHSVRILNQGFVQQGIDLQKNEDKYNAMLENLGELKEVADETSGSPLGDSPGGGINGLNEELKETGSLLALQTMYWQDEMRNIENAEQAFKEWMEELKGGKKEAIDWKNVAQTAAENTGEMFATMIQSGADAEAMIKRLIGQFIRMTILQSLGPVGGFIGGAMRVFGMQHGGMVRGMPMINMRPNLTIANENPQTPEMIVPIEKFKDLIQVNVRGAATADIFLDASKLPQDVKDKFTRDVTSPSLVRDNRR